MTERRKVKLAFRKSRFLKLAMMTFVELQTLIFCKKKLKKQKNFFSYTIISLTFQLKKSRKKIGCYRFNKKENYFRKRLALF